MSDLLAETIVHQADVDPASPSFAKCGAGEGEASMSPADVTCEQCKTGTAALKEC